MKYAYRLTQRPASWGTYPDESRGYEPEITEEHWPPRVGLDGRNHYATVQYPEALPFDMIWRYDLIPSNAVEAAHYLFWDESKRDAIYAAENEKRWLAHDRHLLVAMRDRGDGLAEAALTILEANDG